VPVVQRVTRDRWLQCQLSPFDKSKPRCVCQVVNFSSVVLRCGDGVAEASVGIDAGRADCGLHLRAQPRRGPVDSFQAKTSHRFGQPEQRCSRPPVLNCLSHRGFLGFPGKGAGNHAIDLVLRNGAPPSGSYLGPPRRRAHQRDGPGTERSRPGTPNVANSAPSMVADQYDSSRMRSSHGARTNGKGAQAW